MKNFKTKNINDLFKNKKALYALFLALDAYYNSKYCKIMDFCDFCEFLNKKINDMDEVQK